MVLFYVICPNRSSHSFIICPAGREIVKCYLLNRGEKELLGNLTIISVQWGGCPLCGFSRTIQQIQHWRCFVLFFTCGMDIVCANNKHLYSCIPLPLYLCFVSCEMRASTVGAMRQHYSLGDWGRVCEILLSRMFFPICSWLKSSSPQF